MRFLVLFIILLPAISGARDLTSEELSYQRTQDRLERLERDINLVQKQLYKGGAKTSSRSKSYDKNLPKVDVRIGQLEEEMLDLNGKIEEVEFGISNITKKLDKIISDIDFRISALEESKPAVANIDRVANPLQEMAVAVEDSGGKRKEISQYDNAFRYLRMTKYEDAEREFREFIGGNDGNELLGNAYYWLGETYYIREKYEQAAVNFLKGYKDFPDGNKVANSLAKLAMSLGKLGKKKEACTTFSKFLSEYPDSEENLKNKVESQKNYLECN